MTKNDEKMAKKAQIDAYRAYLMAEVGKAQNSFIYYSSAASGEWQSRKLANQWFREVKNLNRMLDKEFEDAEEFEWDAELWDKRNSYPLH